MNSATPIENRASRSRSQREGESSPALCDRPSQTRDPSPRQLPTDHDYAVPTREYQTDQSSFKLPRLPLALSSKNKHHQQPHRCAALDRVTPYQSRYQKWSTTALYPGSTFTLGRHVNLDPYCHQNNTGKNPNQQLNQLGLIANFYFSVKKK